MLLSIQTTHRPATDLGFLLHKHPDRFQSFELAFGRAHVFYPQAEPECCTACLLLEVDPVKMVRSRGEPGGGLLAQYVNDRPWVASSFLSVAIARVFGTALRGTCQQRPELAGTPLPLTVRLDVLPVRGGRELLHRLFEPLGYQVQATGSLLDEQFPPWGDSPYYSVRLRAEKTLAELLQHLYVLIPVFDDYKHYFVGRDELEKLLEKGSLWLAQHPCRELIARRYLKYRPSLAREALARLMEQEQPVPPGDDSPEERPPDPETLLERPLSLSQQRQGTVLAVLRGSGARSVVDLGCGEGSLLERLLKEPQLERIVGMDVSIRALEAARRRLKLDRLPEAQRRRLELFHGSLMYRDDRLAGFDAAVLMEVIEHQDPPRLRALEKVVFAHARPRTVILTTPNQEYNRLWPALPAGSMRHPDHRFEWTRQQFQHWATQVAGRYGYQVRFVPVGPEHPECGPPTQMAVFQQQ